MKVVNIDIDKVSQFSDRDKAFLTNNTQFQAYQKFPSSIDSIEDVIKARAAYSCDRALLHEVLSYQYTDHSASSLTKTHIQAIKEENCYTIVTAHQPSLMTGPLYYVFKILSAINLASKLKEKYPSKQFVPVFIIGSEDHDFEEINHFYLFGKPITWHEEGSGPVGQYPIEQLESIIDLTLETLGTQNRAASILTQLKDELPTYTNYNDFAFRITQLLFDHLGLVILKMDSPKLKKAFAPLIKKEILEQLSKPLVNATQAAIEENLGYKEQAFARDINFFYIKGRSRNRIEYTDGRYNIIDTGTSFTREEMEAEIETHPDRFSPNVVMRPIYQEYILPNLAYIGGGGELAYWLERKTQFEAFNISYPMLIRRTSGMILNGNAQKQLDKLGMTLEDSFSDEQSLINKLIADSTHPNYDLTTFQEKVKDIFAELSIEVEKIDPTLVKTTNSEAAKAQKSIQYLESKLKKSIKQKESININRIAKMKQQLFPKGLQERHDNIFQYLATEGTELIDKMLVHADPFDKKMKVFVLD